MAITRQKKEDLIKNYLQDLKDSENLVVVKQSGVAVNDSTKIRKSVMGFGGKFNVIRKRLFLRALKDAGYQDISLEQLDGSVFALYSKGDEYGSLKIINKYLKDYKSNPKSTSSFSFLGGWFDKKWYDGDYVYDLANIPSKEELISKLAYLLNYPLQGFVGVLDQIAKKIDESANEVIVEEIKEEVKEEIKEEVKEEVKGEIKEEVKEEVKENQTNVDQGELKTS